jgi:hypothetical protein
MRIRMGRMAPPLCAYRSLLGYVVVAASHHEADVLMTAPNDLEAATKLPLGERAEQPLASEPCTRGLARRHDLSVSPSSY